MKTLILAFLLMACLACNRPPDPGPRSTHEVRALSGLNLPPSGRLVVDDKEPRSGAEGHYLRLIHSIEEIRMPGNSVSLPAATALAAITAHIPSDEAGNSVEANAQSGEWTNENGTWRGVVVRTTKGYWLYLEQFATLKK